MPQLRAIILSQLLFLASISSAEDPIVEVVADGLTLPWAVAFLPDGGYLVTERAGRLLRLAADGRIAAEVAGVPEVLFQGQGGLMDLVLDPAFADNGRLYLSYARGTTRANTTTIHTARLEGDALVDGQDIFSTRPVKTTPSTTARAWLSCRTVRC